VPGLENYVRDTNAAILLGKAAFWDMQVGSDGQACASCHFHAGADTRIRNQLNPGTLSYAGSPFTEEFNWTGSGRLAGPNYKFRPDDFPFHVKVDPNDGNSGEAFDTDDVASSHGSFLRDFWTTDPDPSGAKLKSVKFEECDVVFDDIFHVNGKNTRRAEPRHTPTVINAVFNFRNFWDGRANNIFNGANPFGARDEEPDVVVVNSDGSTFEEEVRLKNSSLASQAVGPPLSDFEMSCRGRMFAELGRKLLDGPRPLRRQKIHPNDSVLGSYRHNSGKGITLSYSDLIEMAFEPKYWSSDDTFDGFSHKERNFSLFWGLAIQLYETTLVSDQTRFDEFTSGDSDALTSEEQNGLNIFMDKGKCINCHKGADFTGAGSVLQAENQEGGLVERMLMSDENRGPALYDNGFYNIGVRPTFEDVSVGEFDPFGNPLSFTRQYIRILLGQDVPDPFEVNPCKFEIRFDASNAGDLDGDGDNDPFPSGFEFNQISCDDGTTALEPKKPSEASNPDLQQEIIEKLRTAEDGAFKVPGLRNVELTGPFFHNGGQSTLEQVVTFYNRGGDFANENKADLDPDIQQLGLSPEEQQNLVAFLKALTDERVRWEKAPFDHPQLFVPNGHKGGTNSVQDDNGDWLADDRVLKVKEVGAAGRPASLGPLKTFEQILADG
jgi:cytochrome c peroxidase